MRIEIVILAALAAFASAAPQWPYRDAVAPYYYGYPGKTPYMYRSGDEDDERDETYNLGRQDLKVATPDGGSTVTVVEDDEKADGVRVVETGSAKPLKPVVQSANNNQQQGDQQQPAAASQAQQPLSSNNVNNAQQQTPSNGQPLTVQQPGQQPPAFPPARPTNANRPRPAEDEDEEEEDDESEEDDEDAEDEEDDGDDDNDSEDEEDDEDRRRDAIAQKEAASSEEPSQQSAVVQREEAQASIPATEGSDEVIPEEPQPVVVEQPHQIPSQSSVLSNKVNKNKQSAAAVASVPVAAGKSKKKAVTSKVKPNSGAIEALVPGYVTDQGEVLVPVDTVTGSQPITIVPDPFSPPSRIVSGPRPIPQSAVPNTPSRQVPYWYRSSPVVNPLTQDLSRQTLYTAVPPPGSIFTFDDDDDDDDADDSPAIVPGNRLRQDADDDDDEEADEDEEEEDRKKKAQQPQKVPLAAVPAVGNSGEDDEAEALAFVNSGRPVANRKPAVPTGQSQSAGSGNKKPGPGGKPTGQAGSNESDSEEDPESEEDDVDSNEDEEEDDSAARAGASPAQIAAIPSNRGRMYVDEDFVSFPPSRSPAIFALIQGGSKYAGPGQTPQRRQPQIISVPNPGNPHQRYVVRVTPSNRPSRPPTSSPVYYRPHESGPPPNRRVVPVASFDVSVEDTRPSSSSFAVDSEEDSDTVSVGGPGYPFVYKVQGSVQGLRIPSGGSGGPQSLASLLGGPQSLAGLLGGSQSYSGRPPRPSFAYYGAAFSSGGPGSRPPRPGPPGPYGYGPRPAYSFSSSVYGSPYGPPSRPSASHSYGPPRPRPSGPSGGPPIIVRRKQPGGGPNRPPKPHLIAVYNPTGSSSSGPREPIDEEYYTFEVPEHNNKIVSGGGPPKNNKRPTVHRKPTPVIHQKLVSEDEEASSEEQSPAPGAHQVQIIPQGTVRRIRGGKQLKPKKNSKKTSSSSSKKQQQSDQQDPLGLLSKINKSKSKMH